VAAVTNRVIIAAILLAAGGALGDFFRFVGRTPGRPADLEGIPAAAADYQGREEPFDAATYEVLNATSATLRQYAGADGSMAELFVAYFASQRFGAGIHSPRHCLPGGGWQIVRHEAAALEAPGGPARTVNRLLIEFEGRQSLMLYWYQTRSGVVRGEYGLKLDLLRNALAMRPTDAALVRVTVPVAGDEGEAMARAVQFARTIDPYVQQALPF